MLLGLLIGLPCTAGMFLYANEILLLLFPHASDGGVLLAISSFTIIFTILAQTINGILQGFGKVKTPVVALGIGVIAKTIANLILMPIAGIYENGAAIGSVLCHLISFVIVYTVLLRTVKLNFSLFKLSVKPVIATILMSVISYVVYIGIKTVLPIRIATIITIVVALIVFVMAILLLKVFSKEEIEMLPKGERVYRLLKKLHFCD